LGLSSLLLGQNLVPLPPAMITAYISLLPPILHEIHLQQGVEAVYGLVGHLSLGICHLA